LLLGENLPVMDVGDGHLGRGNEVVVPCFELEQVFLELRQLPRAGHGGAVDHERRQHLRIAVLAGMQVQHKIDEGALQQGAVAQVQGKPRPGDFRGTLEIEDVQVLADVPVRFHREVEHRRRSHALHFGIVVLVASHRDAVMGKVGNAHQQGLDGGFAVVQCFFQGFDARGHLPHLRHHVIRVLPGLFQLRDLVRHHVSPVTEAFDFPQDLASLRIGGVEHGQIDGFAAVCHRRLDAIKILSDELDFEHENTYINRLILYWSKLLTSHQHELQGPRIDSLFSFRV
jgi:hypothetical protein